VIELSKLITAIRMNRFIWSIKGPLMVGNLPQNAKGKKAVLLAKSAKSDYCEIMRNQLGLA
jgi:hypothetical protein